MGNNNKVVDDMAKIEQDANIEDVANSIAEDMYPYPSHMKYAFGGKGLVDADRFKIVKGFKLGAQWQKQRDADTIAQLQATNLELSKRVFELEKGISVTEEQIYNRIKTEYYKYSNSSVDFIRMAAIKIFEILKPHKHA